ncbi:ATP-binding protein [Salinigranum sp. GCM10025319]|uniref:hybrid sensor histidine kinase/response regulator n=1 Tax=Salinigranum sp. GCM10025319 TaxID=3252687 RepID=UPI00360F42F5
MTSSGRPPVDGSGDGVHVLHVDDDPAVLDRTEAFLTRRAGFVVHTEAEPEAALTSLSSVDCVVSGYDMPGMDGLDLLRAVRERDPTLPFVLFTDSGSEAVAGEAIAAGVTAYVPMDVDDADETLAERIERAVARVRDESTVGVATAEGGTDEVAVAGVESNPDIEAVSGVEAVSDVEAVSGIEPVTGITGTGGSEHGSLGAGEDGGAGEKGAGVVAERDRLRRELDASQRSLRRVYTVTTDTSLSFADRVERTLAIGRERLGVSLGFLTRIADGTQTVAHAVGDHPQLQRGETCPLSESYCRRTLDTDGLLAVVHAAADESWADDPSYERFGLESYLGGKVVVDGDLYGTVCFADTEPRGEPFTESQAVFVELLTRWMGYELERCKRERELRVADRRFRSLFDNPMTFVGVLDPDGTLRELNDTARATLDGDADTVLGQPFWETSWWTPDPDSVAAVEEAVETAASGQVARFECDYYAADGQGTVGATLYPVYATGGTGAVDGTAEGDAEGEVVSLMAVGADTTTRTEQATQLKRQRDRLDEFASVVSHDVRSPLETARGRLQLYDATGEADHLDAIERSLDRIATLVDDLLALARQGESVSELEPTPVPVVARQAWNTVEAPAATLDVTLDTGMTVESDPSRLQQLFENLFRNSVEHGSTGSRSQARGNCVEHGSTGSRPKADDAVEHSSASSRSHAHGNAVEHGSTDGTDGIDETGDDTGHVAVRLVGLDDARGFAVEDDGPGIPVAERERVFERGFSTNDDGTGFGLAIVQRIVEAHGWTVRIAESAPGGARFEVRVDS